MLLTTPQYADDLESEWDRKCSYISAISEDLKFQRGGECCYCILLTTRCLCRQSRIGKKQLGSTATLFRFESDAH